MSFQCSQRAPGTGELVMMGVDAVEPFWEVGVVSGNIYLISICKPPAYVPPVRVFSSPSHISITLIYS